MGPSAPQSMRAVLSIMLYRKLLWAMCGIEHRDITFMGINRCLKDVHIVYCEGERRATVSSDNVPSTASGRRGVNESTHDEGINFRTPTLLQLISFKLHVDGAQSSRGRCMIANHRGDLRRLYTLKNHHLCDHGRVFFNQLRRLCRSRVLRHIRIHTSTATTLSPPSIYSIIPACASLLGSGATL